MCALMATSNLDVWDLPTLKQYLLLLKGAGSSCLCHEVLQRCMRQRWGALGVCEAAAQQVQKKCWTVLQAQGEAFGTEQRRCEEEHPVLLQVEQLAQFSQSLACIMSQVCPATWQEDLKVGQQAAQGRQSH